MNHALIAASERSDVAAWRDRYATAPALFRARRFLPLLAILFGALAPTPARAQDDSAAIIARIESPQKPDHQGLAILR
jgi:hypothetical protein